MLMSVDVLGDLFFSLADTTTSTLDNVVLSLPKRMSR